MQSTIQDQFIIVYNEFDVGDVSMHAFWDTVACFRKHETALCDMLHWLLMSINSYES